MKIRRAKTDEWSSLQDLNEKAMSGNSNFDSDVIENWAYSSEGEKYFQELVSNARNLCLVAEEDNGELVGYIAAHPKDITYRKSKYIEIENMGVTPEYRSKGIGQKLMRECMEWAKERGFQKAYVSSYSSNEVAIRFYKKNGFSEIDISFEKEI